MYLQARIVTMMPDVREITYGRKSINVKTSEAEDNAAPKSYADIQSSSPNIVLIKNVTKDKKIGAYSESPWFDDALR